MGKRIKIKTTTLIITEKSNLKDIVKYICTDCGGDATIAWSNTTKKDKNYFGAIFKTGERVCLPCGKKRGVNFF